MNTKNAVVFLLVGVVMKLLPWLEPHWFQPGATSAVDGQATATWVVCMGLIEAALGGGYLIKHHVWPFLRRVGAYRPAPQGEMALQRVSE